MAGWKFHSLINLLFVLPLYVDSSLDAQTVRPNDTTIDCFKFQADLTIPKLVSAKKMKPEQLAGNRFRETVDEFRKSDVYHVTYLPTNWKPKSEKKKWPVIIEFTGNGPYKNKRGDYCSGKVEDAKLGYGLSGGKQYIWVSLPFVDHQANRNVEKWWGDRPKFSPASTINYCKKAVPWICQKWGGDIDRVVLVGFSRGAIACNYIGLHDEEIAKLWCGFVAYSHYDGVNESWPYPESDRASAKTRLARLGNRPQFICAEAGKGLHSIQATRSFLSDTGNKGRFTFRTIGTSIERDNNRVFAAFPNHHDGWILRPSDTRQELRIWLKKLTAKKPVEQK